MDENGDDVVRPEEFGGGGGGWSACTYTTKELIPAFKLSSISKQMLVFFLNEHANLQFLLHNNSVHIILLDLKKI